MKGILLSEQLVAFKRSGDLSESSDKIMEDLPALTDLDFFSFLFKSDPPEDFLIKDQALWKLKDQIPKPKFLIISALKKQKEQIFN